MTRLGYEKTRANPKHTWAHIFARGLVGIMPPFFSKPTSTAGSTTTGRGRIRPREATVCRTHCSPAALETPLTWGCEPENRRQDRS